MQWYIDHVLWLVTTVLIIKDLTCTTCQFTRYNSDYPRYSRYCIFHEIVGFKAYNLLGQVSILQQFEVPLIPNQLSSTLKTHTIKRVKLLLGLQRSNFIQTQCTTHNIYIYINKPRSGIVLILSYILISCKPSTDVLININNYDKTII